MVKKLIGCGRGMMRRRQRRNCNSPKGCRVTALSNKSDCGPTKVYRINGDRKHCARMASLGLYPGNEIELIGPLEADGCILKVHGGTVSIDRETMDNILVSE